MNDFTTQAPGRTRSDNEPSTEVKDSELTQPDAASPHFLVCTIRDKDDADKVIARWGVKYGTRDAADSQRSDIREAMRSMRGEPEQAWSEVARMCKCPYPPALALHKNLEMSLEPVRERAASTGFTPDHPAYIGSEAERRDRELAAAGAQPNGGGGASGESRGGTTKNPRNPRSRAKSSGRGKLRADTPKDPASVPAKRGGAKAGQGKAKRSAKAKAAKGKRS